MATSRDTDYLIDTSVFVALEQERALGALPESGRWFVSAITIGELKHGVLAAEDPIARARRLDTWVDARERFAALPVDAVVANTWGEFRAIAQVAGRRIAAADGLIAATAATYGLTLVTQDRDFDWFPDLDVLVV